MLFKKTIELIFLLLSGVFACFSAKAQNNEELNLEVLSTPMQMEARYSSLFQLIITNHSSEVEVNYTINIIRKEIDTLIIRNTLLLKNGINNVETDGSKAIGDFHSFFTSDSLFIPGSYQIEKSIEYANKPIHNEKYEITIPFYKIKTNVLSKDSVAITIIPECKECTFYLIVFKQEVAISSHKISPIFAQSFFSYDSSKFHYEIQGYYRNKFIGKEFIGKRPSKLILSQINKVKKLYEQQQLIRIGGTVGVEYYSSNLNYVGQVIPNQYTRIFIMPEISIWGIPFKANYLATTEQSNQFPMNSISFELDGLKLNDILKNQATQQINAINEEIEGNSYTIDDLVKQNKNLNNQYTHDSILLLNLPDSSGIGNKRKQNLKAKQFQRKEQLMKNEMILSKLKERNEKLKRINRHYNKSINPETLDTNIRIPKSKYNNFIRVISRIHDLKIGLIYPQFNDLLYSGLPFEGIYVNYTLGNANLKMAQGKTPLIFSNTFNSANTNLQSTLIGASFNNRKKTNLFKLEYAKFKDDRQVQTENEILLIGNEFKLIKPLTLFIEVAKGAYSFTGAVSETRKQSIPLFEINNLNSVATACGVALNLNQTQVKFTYKRIDGSYKSFGAPFLRSDAEQFDATISQSLQEGKINIECGLNLNQDNLSGNKSSTNQINGWHLKGRIHYPKIPKITISYRPVILSSAFNSNLTLPQDNITMSTQQYINFMATCDYSFKTGRIIHHPLISYNSFKTNSPFLSSTVILIQSQIRSEYSNQLTSIVNYIHQYRNDPNLQFHTLEASIQRKLNKINSNLSIGWRDDFTLNQSRRKGVFCHFNTLIKNLNTYLQLGINKVDGIWGNNYYVNFIEFRIMTGITLRIN